MPPAAVAAEVAVVVARLTGEPGSVGVIAPASLVTAVSASLTAAGIGHGVLGADHGDVDHQVDVVPATVAKGSSSTGWSSSSPPTIAADEPDERTGLRRLYVVLTRAVSALTVVHSTDLPGALRDSHDPD